MSKINDLISETQGYAVLDCGCPNTVCGEKWMENYISLLVEDDRKRIEFEPSSQTFTFGDGAEVKSKRTMNIPCWMQVFVEALPQRWWLVTFHVCLAEILWKRLIWTLSVRKGRL